MANSDIILVLNAGSSSLKFAVYGRNRQRDWRPDSRGQIDGFGQSATFFARDAAGRVMSPPARLDQVGDAGTAMQSLLPWLQDHYDDSRVLAVGHRVVHGGAQFEAPVVVTPAVLEALRNLIPLAPLHQPHNLAAIDSVAERWPDVPQVACFDTSFHRTQGPLAELVPVPREIREAGVQRYGFHGISIEYIASVLPELAPEIAGGRVVVAHLGSGASLCALKEGRSIDSTFGFTALDGLCMGSRPGSIDPGVVLYLFQQLGWSADEVETLLYRKSGLKAISGLSGDMRVLQRSDLPEASLAVDYFVYRAVKELGALAAVLGGLDGLVFTAGIGEHSGLIRQRICDDSRWLGVELDPAANAAGGPRISTGHSRVSAWVIPTNEELMIARHMGRLLGFEGDWGQGPH